MDWLKEHEEDLKWVFAKSEAIIARFPSPINQLGLEYLEKFHVFREDSAKNYVCYLLPFWLKDIAPVEISAVKRLALANVFVMLYFFIQDDLMDSSNPQPSVQLPLGNLFYLEFLNIYRDYFPSDSPFWTYFNIYITEWSESVTNERERNFFLNDLKRTALKASPVKLASTGVCLLIGQTNLISQVTDAVDHTLVTLQMVDDWADWQEDLEEGAYNGLLAMITSELQLSESIELTEEQVKKALFVQGSLNRYTEIARTNGQHLMSIGINAPHLLSFNQHLLNTLIEGAASIEKQKQRLAMGGFYHWVFK
jgi:hypothetical protein